MIRSPVAEERAAAQAVHLVVLRVRMAVAQVAHRQDPVFLWWSSRQRAR